MDKTITNFIQFIKLKSQQHTLNTVWSNFTATIYFSLADNTNIDMSCYCLSSTWGIMGLIENRSSDLYFITKKMHITFGKLFPKIVCNMPRVGDKNCESCSSFPTKIANKWERVCVALTILLHFSIYNAILYCIHSMTLILSAFFYFLFFFEKVVSAEMLCCCFSLSMLTYFLFHIHNIFS